MITNEKCGLRWPLSLKLCPLLYYLIYFYFVLIEKVSCEQKMNMKFYLFSTGEFNSPRGPVCWVSMFTLYYWFKFFSPPFEHCDLFPKGEFLRGFPLVECLSLPCTIYSTFLRPLRTLLLIPQRTGLSLLGAPFVWMLSFLYLIVLEKFYPPTKHKKFGLIPQSRGSLKNLSEGSHLFECSLSFILLFWKIFTPYEAWKFLSYSVSVGVGRIYLWNFLGVQKWVLKKKIFFICL